MRTSNLQDRFADVSFVKLKDEGFLSNQRQAGKIAADTLSLLQNLVKDKTTKSLSELSNLAEEYIISRGGLPTFKNYGTPPFPAAVCISVNEQLVHGVPSDYVLKDGDMVSFDLGVTINGAIADTALTCVYGQPTAAQEHLIAATEECLMRAIDVVKVGARIGEIGNTIYRCAKAKGYNVYTAFGGHGLDLDKPHSFPFIANRADPQEGVRIQEGMTIAIEPLLTQGPTDTKIGIDRWTVFGRQLNCHCEHTLFVHSDHTEIITQRSQ